MHSTVPRVGLKLIGALVCHQSLNKWVKNGFCTQVFTFINNAAYFFTEKFGVVKKYRALINACLLVYKYICSLGVVKLMMCFPLRPGLKGTYISSADYQYDENP